MDGEQLGMIGIAAGLFGLVVAFFLYNKVNSIKIENETVAKITGRIYDGAMAFLWAEYRLLSGFIVITIFLQYPASASSIELSTTSKTI